jgi:hypothetical protein
MFEIVPVTSLADAAIAQRTHRGGRSDYHHFAHGVLPLSVDIPIARPVEPIPPPTEANPILLSAENESPLITPGVDTVISLRNRRVWLDSAHPSLSPARPQHR